jgi:DNA replication protein DnaD
LKAWMHLLYTVNHSDKKILFDRELITVKRGQLITSQRKLADAWGCSVMTVRAILDLMCKDEMITVETDRKKTLLTVVNYDVYQLPETDSRTETITETRTDSRTVSRTPSRTVNSIVR